MGLTTSGWAHRKFSFSVFVDAATKHQKRDCAWFTSKSPFYWNRKVFLSLEAALDYFSLEDIDADSALIPSNVDNLLNKDELDDEDTATPSVHNIPSLVEVVNAEEEDGYNMPCASGDQKPSAKK